MARTFSQIATYQSMKQSVEYKGERLFYPDLVPRISTGLVIDTNLRYRMYNDELYGCMDRFLVAHGLIKIFL